jgi:hypothetical protein
MGFAALNPSYGRSFFTMSNGPREPTLRNPGKPGAGPPFSLFFPFPLRGRTGYEPDPQAPHYIFYFGIFNSFNYYYIELKRSSHPPPMPPLVNRAQN